MSRCCEHRKLNQDLTFSYALSIDEHGKGNKVSTENTENEQLFKLLEQFTAMETALRLLASEIVNLRTDLLAIKAMLAESMEMEESKDGHI